TVQPDASALTPGDKISIDSRGIGRLRNMVEQQGGGRLTPSIPPMDSPCLFRLKLPQSRRAAGTFRTPAPSHRSDAGMERIVRWALIALTVSIVGVAPVVFYRAVYSHDKRLREVAPGLVYRSGQLTAQGFIDACRSLNIKTIINLQDDFPDPDLSYRFLDWRTIKESELCRMIGVKYVFIGPDLTWRQRVGKDRPEAIEQFLA